MKDKKYTQSFSRNFKHNSFFKINNGKIFSIRNGSPQTLLELKKVKLKGEHNIDNILAAATIAHLFGVKDKFIKQATVKFSPIPHRLETIRTLNGVEYINDSKSTNIESTIVALKSISKKIILIIGGRAKPKTDYQKLNLYFENVEFLFCYGELSNQIKNKSSFKVKFSTFNDFDSAIYGAIKHANNGYVVLLSPGCSSFDQFDNFEQRGEKFKTIINNLKN